MRNEKGQFIKGHKVLKNNPFTKGNTIGPRFKKGYRPWNKDKKTGPLNEKWKEKISKALSGRKATDEQKAKLRKPKLNGDSQYWFGSKEEYKAIHHWVNKTYGKPDDCDRCTRKGLTGRQIHWSNVSGSYKLERSDWRRLCAKCHAYVDKSAKGIKHV